jgi:hypothetical protein
MAPHLASCLLPMLLLEGRHPSNMSRSVCLSFEAELGVRYSLCKLDLHRPARRCHF